MNKQQFWSKIITASQNVHVRRYYRPLIVIVQLIGFFDEVHVAEMVYDGDARHPWSLHGNGTVLKLVLVFS